MNILMLLDNVFTHDRRVLKEAESLVKFGHQLTLVCMVGEGLASQENIAGIQVIRMITNEALDVKNTRYLDRLADELVARFQFEVVHCHDQLMFHLGTLVKKRLNKTVLLYDSHELFHGWPLNVTYGASPIIRLKSYLVRKFLIWREKRNAKHIDHLVTVNHSLANNLKGYFNLSDEPVCVRNIPETPMRVSRNTRIRDHFDIGAEVKIIVYVGANIYVKTRNLEQAIDEVGNQPGLALVFICGESSGKQGIMDYVAAQGFQNIYFHARVPEHEIVECLSSCDVGIVPTWNKKDLSYWYALDNKLFYYMMAQIPILATQQPEYKNIVEAYNIGVCVNPDEPNAYYNGAMHILENYSEYANPLLEARQSLNWEKEKDKLIGLYKKIAKQQAKLELV